MINKVIGTLGTRIINAIIVFLIVILNSHNLGAAGVGTISLIIFSVTILQLFTNFVAGSAIIYLVPREKIFRLFIPAYVWIILITFVGTAILWVLQFVFPDLETIPKGYTGYVIILTLISSMISANGLFLLGQEKIRDFNMVNLIQVVLMVLLLLVFYLVLKRLYVSSYLYALFISQFIGWLIGLGILIPGIKPASLRNLGPLLKEIFRFGTYVQLANIFQLFNYRLSYYFIDYYLGRAALGVLAVGLQVAEGLWIISRSMSLVQYSRIANEKNFDYSVKISMIFSKISWVITLICMVILLVIPDGVYQWVFGREFIMLKPVIASLGLGIIVFSISIILSTFYSGNNKPYHNTISSGIGIVFTLAGCVILIPLWGIPGAGITASVSYLASTLYQFIIFSRMSHLGFRDLLIKKTELTLLTGEMRKWVTRG